MNIERIKKALLPLFLATIIIVAFNWQFIKIYNFLIVHFTTDRLSTLYAHLFVYSFLILTLFIFIINLLNHFLIKSKVFVFVTIFMLLTFYTFSYETLTNTINYFIHYPLSNSAIMGMVLFVVGTFAYALYNLVTLLFNRFIPLSHAILFLLLALIYAASFINQYCYPVLEIMTRLSK